MPRWRVSFIALSVSEIAFADGFANPFGTLDLYMQAHCKDPRDESEIVVANFDTLFS